MLSRVRLFLACLIFSLYGVCSAQIGTLRLSTFPNATVADSRSTLTITAEVRDSSGKLVADGTQVLFQTTLGSFRESTQTTINGYARAIFIAGSVPGTAKITASCIQLGQISSFEVELLSDRSLLSSSREYAEIVSPGYLQMSYEKKVLAASGPDGGVKLRFLDTTISADDLQLDPNTLEVRARRATLDLNHQSRYFSELYFNMQTRKGYGLTKMMVERPSGYARLGWGFQQLTEQVERVVSVSIKSAEPQVEPTGLPNPDIFKFSDLSQSVSMIAAKKALIFPNRQIQFQKAEILVDGSRMFKMPLFEVRLDGASTPILGDSIVNVTNSRPSINFPTYLSLKPGETSLLRFHTGDRFGRGLATNNGAFVDYELNWNRGADSDGGIVFGGLGRNDWTFNARHFLRMGNGATASMQFDSPSGRSAFSSLNFSQGFKGYQASLNFTNTTSLRGDINRSNIASLVVERDPIQAGKLPVKFYLGATASSQSLINVADRTSQTGVGLRLRSQLDQRKIDKRSTLDGSVTLTRLSGHNTPTALGVVGNLAIRQSVSRSSFLSLGYDYIDDGLHNSISGRHRLTMQGFLSQGRITAQGMASRGLDGLSSSTQLDLGYTLGGPWRLGYSQTFDRYIGNSFFDYNAILAYRFGPREFGLSYSRRTNRFGFQLLGTPLN